MFDFTSKTLIFKDYITLSNLIIVNENTNEYSLLSSHIFLNLWCIEEWNV